MPATRPALTLWAWRLSLPEGWSDRDPSAHRGSKQDIAPAHLRRIPQGGLGCELASNTSTRTRRQALPQAYTHAPL